MAELNVNGIFCLFQCLLMGEGQASELGLSTAGQALMGKIPPTHFCSTVVRLLALQVRALGETYSLEQACGVQYTMLATPHDKSDILLMHLLIPMCLRVGTGRKGMCGFYENLYFLVNRNTI